MGRSSTNVAGLIESFSDSSLLNSTLSIESNPSSLKKGFIFNFGVGVINCQKSHRQIVQEFRFSQVSLWTYLACAQQALNCCQLSQLMKVIIFHSLEAAPSLSYIPQTPS